MSKTKEVIGDVGSYSSALLLTQFVTIVSSIITRKFLGPVQMGVWSFVQVILSYADYAALGTLSAVVLKIPFYHGKGDAEKANSIKNTVFFFSITTSILASIAMLIYAVYQKSSIPQELFFGFLFASALIILQKINGLMISLIRAYKKFDLAGKQMFYSAIVNALLIAILSYQFRLYGFMIAMCFSFIFNIAYILLHHKFNFKFSVDWSELFELIKYGLPLMVITLMTTFFETIDRVMISHYLGFEALGLYGIGLLAFNYINSVPNAVSIVVIPNLQEKYGKTENMHELKGFLNKSDFLVTGLIPAFVGVTWFVMPVFIYFVLPKFVGGIPAMQFLILSAYFVSVGQAYLQFIYVIKKHLLLLPFTIGSCVAAFAFNWLAIRWGLGIRGVAIATTLAIAFNFTSIFFYSSRQVFSFKEIIKNYSVIIFKFLIMLGALLILENFIHLESLILSAVLKTILFLLIYIPFFIESNKRFDLINIIKSKLTRKK